jgi:RNA polymerase sigma-70 factor (ECF subfamily)
MRIARNATLDYLRSRKKWTDVSSPDEDAIDYWDRLPGTDLAADEMMHISQQQDWLQECINKLPEEQREVLLMRHEGELTFREIADLTDCSINTALGRMRYALLNLRKMMEDSKLSNLADYQASTG